MSTTGKKERRTDAGVRARDLVDSLLERVATLEQQRATDSESVYELAALLGRIEAAIDLEAAEQPELTSHELVENGLELIEGGLDRGEPARSIYELTPSRRAELRQRAARRTTRCPCGDMASHDCAGECGRLEARARDRAFERGWGA